MSQSISIGSRKIGENQPCFIIAEAGVNHNGNPQTAKKMIDCAVNAGADAVKFQSFKVDALVTKDAKKAKYQERCTGSNTQYEMLKKLELRDQDFKKLANYAADQGIIFLSTPFDKGSVDLLEKVNVPAYKISSGELTNHPLLTYIASKTKPIILSTGMSTLSEIGEALSVIKESGNSKIAILHCTTDYPALFEETNLNAIITLQCAFKRPTGFSDHTPGIIASVAAVALGACIIEKHFTLNKEQPGPDHKASLNPKELTDLVRSIRNIELAMGDGIKEPSANERNLMAMARKSIVAKKNITHGTILDESMVDFKRPGTGLEPKFLSKIVGRRIKMDIKKDEMLYWEFFA